MATPQERQRKAKLNEVLSALPEDKPFELEEVASQCSESTTRFVDSVLTQLSNDQVLFLVRSEDDGPTRYGWLIDRHTFDAGRWIDDQVHGNQVTQAPVQERPRERLLELGADALTNSELLAILIRAGRKGESAVQSGQRLARHFDQKLERIVQYSPSEMKQVSGAVNQVAYCQIMAGIELGRRVAEASRKNAPKVKINSTQAAVDYCSRHFSRLAHDATQEEFHILTLDTKLQPIQSHQITIGTLDASLVHPREVFKPAIRDSASSILLIHNHPSGDPTPSRQDREVTQRLKSAGELLGIQVVDHIIVAREETISLAEWD